jgi:anti-repressor protein
MQELIKINTKDQTVSARDLYDFLELDKSQWSRWTKKNIEKNEFAISGTDWLDIVSRGATKDFVLTLDFAKRLAMMSRSERGEQARRYFLECEKELKQPTKPATYLDLAQVMIESIKAQESRMAQIEQKAIEIEARIDTIDTNFISVVGYARINNIQLPGNEALKIGKQAGKISREQGITIGKVFDAKYGSINTYHKDILQTVFHNSTAR